MQKTRRNHAWWWPESRRALVSTGVAMVVTALAVSAWVLWNPGDAALALPLGTVLTWAVLVACHAGLTAWSFSGLRGADLTRALKESGIRSSRGTLPSWSVQVSVLALLVVAGLVLVPEWRNHSLILAGALVMVSACWADMAVSFGLHYAAIDENRFRFVDDEERGFGDYIYVATALQATGSLPDVTVHSAALRRQVTVHTVLAFVFNTVIVAVVVAILLGS